MDKTRILVVTPNLPFPSFSGFDLRNWQNVNGLLPLGEVGVFALCSNDRLRSKSPSDRLAFWRSTKDPVLSYLPQEGRRFEARGWLLNSSGHPSDIYYSEVVMEELQNLLSEFKPQVAVLEGLWMHHYIEILKDYGCRVILDCHDTQSAEDLPLTDSVLGGDLKSKLVGRILPERVKLIEKRAAHAVDQLWVCSDREAHLMNSLHCPRVPIYVVPNGVDLALYDRAATGERCDLKLSKGNKRTIVYPGLFAYPPNRVAAAFLLEELFPRLEEIFPDCRLLLPGAHPTIQMLDAAKADSRIEVTGAVSDIRPYLWTASTMVVPLRQGTGTRLKIVEAFAAMIPVVSTAKGAEGLAIENEKHLLIAETAEQFVETVQRLWAQPMLAARLTANAFKLVGKQYSWAVAGRRISRAVNDLRKSKFNEKAEPLKREIADQHGTSFDH